MGKSCDVDGFFAAQVPNLERASGNSRETFESDPGFFAAQGLASTTSLFAVPSDFKRERRCTFKSSNAMPASPVPRSSRQSDVIYARPGFFTQTVNMKSIW